MKSKYLGALIILLTIFGCDDNTGSLGLDMLPGSDKMTVKTTTFNFETRSWKVDSVFAKTTMGYVGKFSDPLFGAFDASFLTQFNCTEDFEFPKRYTEDYPQGIVAGDTAHVVYLTLEYDRYFGDSLNASRMSIYQLKDNLTFDKKSYYTTLEPEDYFDKSKLLARKAYTAVDLSVSESVRNTSTYVKSVQLPFPREIGDSILRLNWKHPEYFKNAKTFTQNVFPGIYAKTDYGDGTLLYVDNIYLTIVYPCYVKDTLDTNKIMQDSHGKDSTDLLFSIFSATKEVIQANSFTNSGKIEEMINDPSQSGWTYMKSPAGIFTQANLPINDIYGELPNDTLNSVKLTFTGYQPEEDNNIDSKFQMGPPTQVLLVREKEMETFFEQNKVTDGVTSYLATYSNRTYTFSNITFLINTLINEKKSVMNNEGKNWTEAEWKEWEEKTKWNSILLVPVKLQYESNSTTPIGIQNDLEPKYVKLKGGDQKLTMDVHYTVFH